MHSLVTQDDVKLANTSFKHFIDVQIVISLACLMPMLKCLHSFMQFAQERNVFICDLLDAIKLISVYTTSMKRPGSNMMCFWNFKVLSTFRHDAILVKWMYDALILNISVCEYLYIIPTRHSIKCVHHNLITGEFESIMQELYNLIL